MTVNDLEWLSKIFNDTKLRAVSLRQMSFLFPYRCCYGIIIIIIIIIGFSVYLHNSTGDITQFNNKSMQKTEKF